MITAVFIMDFGGESGIPHIVIEYLNRLYHNTRGLVVFPVLRSLTKSEIEGVAEDYELDVTRNNLCYVTMQLTEVVSELDFSKYAELLIEDDLKPFLKFFGFSLYGLAFQFAIAPAFCGLVKSSSMGTNTLTLYNNDTTSADTVIAILCKVLGKSYVEAEALTFTMHNKGFGVVCDNLPDEAVKLVEILLNNAGLKYAINGRKKVGELGRNYKGSN